MNRVSTPLNRQRRVVLQLGASGLLVAATTPFTLNQAHAEDSDVYKSALNNEAVSGYDPVAYFKEGKPVKGIRQFRLKHKGADWLFSSQENLDLFKEDTEKYSPQYGGHCAFNASKGEAIKGNPNNFNIVNDKLYLNYDNYTQNLWYKNQAELIEKGDAIWPTVLR